MLTSLKRLERIDQLETLAAVSRSLDPYDTTDEERRRASVIDAGLKRRVLREVYRRAQVVEPPGDPFEAFSELPTEDRGAVFSELSRSITDSALKYKQLGDIDERLGTKGLLPLAQFEVRLNPLVDPVHFNVPTEVLRAALENEVQAAHLGVQLSGQHTGTLLSARPRGADFAVLMLAARAGKQLHLQKAWRVYDDLLHGQTPAPFELLTTFQKHFGLTVSVFVRGRRDVTGSIIQELPIGKVHISNVGVRSLSESGASLPITHVEQNAMLHQTQEGDVTMLIAFSIDRDRYGAYLISHNVHVDFSIKGHLRPNS